MSRLPIQIDLRPFIHPFDVRTTNAILVLVGPPGEIGLSTPQQSLQLPPGSYEFIVSSGQVADFTFAVRPDGKLDYDPSLDSFLSGRGSSTLVVKGFEVSFDARYLSGPTTLFVLPDGVPILHTKLRMLPASAYVLEQGSGSVAPWRLKIGLDAKLHYDPALDIARNGFLAGNGTTALQLFGYPLLIDARASGAAAVTVEPTGNVTGSTTGVTFVNLLPTDNVALQLDDKRLPFVVHLNGSLSVEPSLTQFVQFDHFHGLARMTVLRPLA